MDNVYAEHTTAEGYVYIIRCTCGGFWTVVKSWMVEGGMVGWREWGVARNGVG